MGSNPIATTPLLLMFFNISTIFSFLLLLSTIVYYSLLYFP